MKTNSSNVRPALWKGWQPVSFFFRQKYQWSLLCGLLLLCGSAFAGKGGNLIWKLDATVKGVQFYHAISSCDGKSVTFLKFVNSNSYAVNISWKESVQTQFRTEDNLFRGGQHLSLQPGETMADNCTAICKACVLTGDGIVPTYPVQIVSYAFKNITVEK